MKIHVAAAVKARRSGKRKDRMKLSLLPKLVEQGAEIKKSYLE
jgi:hypothetical protein